MDIIIIASVDPAAPRTGGIKSYVYNLRDAIDKLGHSTHIIGINYINLRQEDDNCSFIPIAKNIKSEKKFLLNLFIKLPFLNISKESIIHIQRPEYVLPLIISNSKNLKICTLHGIAFKTITLKYSQITSIMYRLIEPFCLGHIDRLIVVDKNTKKYYEQTYPWLANRIELITTGIDSNIFKLKNKKQMRILHSLNEYDKIAIFVGRLEKEKNIKLLVEAFSLIKDPNTKLLIVGDGRERNNLEALAAELGLNNITFLGMLASENVSELLNCADIFVLPSLHEGSPTVIKEALGCGVPVISTNVGDAADIIYSQDYGFILDDFSAEKMAEMIMIAFLKNWDNNKISKYAEAFSWGKIGSVTLNVYKDKSIELNSGA